jgi:hypothetical protein
MTVRAERPPPSTQVAVVVHVDVGGRPRAKAVRHRVDGDRTA